MSELSWLVAASGPDALPDPEAALSEPNGLLAAGGSLDPDWLLAAYRRGIFPWFEAGQPILWWSPDPRTILLPDELVVSRSLSKRLRREEFQVTADVDFEAVIDACAGPRRYTQSTWIIPAMRDAYVRLHRLGFAHSFEAWSDEGLVGGLYGVAIGRVFFGESMFAHSTDASKVAFWHAVQFLREIGCELIDCQLPSSHLSSLGARSIPRPQFLAEIARLTRPLAPPGAWTDAFRLCNNSRPTQQLSG